jgi:ATP-dependent helicase Lhr and Lhr-like helicase
MVSTYNPRNPFQRLAPFIQEYIYQNNWTDLREVQIEACRVIFDTKYHLLLAAGTASGKTEAAFLPILTELCEQPCSSIGVLYVSPIKALINDQFERLSNLLQQSHLEVHAWHGDIPQSRKRKLLRNPRGILQITPESLESILINQATEIEHLFNDLRFIIIDEIHVFMGSERGNQILCQLGRIERYLKRSPRRIGLSATLGDYTLAEKWLQGGTKIPVITPKIESQYKQVRLSLEHFYLEDDDNSVYSYLFDLSKSCKCLIFGNNRTEAETVISNLREIAKQNNYPDVYHVHHGSISSLLREDAELAMKSHHPAVIAATVTLELGIDLGQLERVIQLNAPFSVSSFLQRLGRTGRRGNPADMRFICTEEKPLLDQPFYQQIPWQLLQSIAVIQLYIEERWLEPIESSQYPFSLLYHQTLSILAAEGEQTPQLLAQKVLTLPIFSKIGLEDYRQLIKYLISINHLQTTEKGNLILGLIGAKIAHSFRFYSVFSENTEYLVRGEIGLIGSIATAPPLGHNLSLAGRTWKVIDIDIKRRSLFVKPVEENANISWWGSGIPEINTRILRKMRQVLLEDHEYAYLQKSGQKRLNLIRQQAKLMQLNESNFLSLDTQEFCWFPWIGSKGFYTLERLLNFTIREVIDLKQVKSISPYYFLIKLGNSSLEDFQKALINICKQDLTNDDLLFNSEAPRINKYDDFIPDNLLRKAYSVDHLDLGELRTVILADLC